MRMLILGSTGMLGRVLLQGAKQKGYTVFGASRSGSDIVVDFADLQSIANAVDAANPDIIINAAALVNLDECERDPGKAYIVNARPAALLAEIAKKKNIYFIQISTDHYYKNDGDMLHDEYAPVQLVNEYSRTKYAGEVFALSIANTLIVRTNIVGFKGSHTSVTFAEWVINSLENGHKMTLYHDFYTSSITVSQLTQALFTIVERGNVYGVLNIASKGVYSKKTFIEHLAHRFGYDLELPEYASVHANSNVPRAESLGLDVSKAERILGYSLPDLGQVIDQLFIEYQEAKRI